MGSQSTPINSTNNDAAIDARFSSGVKSFFDGSDES